MSNIIPPLLSSSPPPLNGTIDDDEDEFGDFTFAADSSYGCDVLSVPSLPQKCNDNENQSIPSSSHSTHDNINSISESTGKDFQDRRKVDDKSKCDVGEEAADSIESSGNHLVHNVTKIKDNVENKYNSFQYFPDVPPDILPDDNEDTEYNKVDDFVGDFEDSLDFESFPISNINTEVQQDDTVLDNNDSKTSVDVSSKTIEPCSNLQVEIPSSVSSEKDLNNLEEKPLEEKNDDSPSVNNDTEECIWNESLQLPNNKGVSHVITETSESKDLEDVNNIEISEFDDSQNLSLPSSSEINQNEETLEQSEGTLEQNEEFKSHPVEGQSRIDSESPDIPTPTPQIASNDDDDDDFGDFENQIFEEQPQSFSAAFSPPDVKFGLQLPSEKDDDDDFGDFNDYSLQTSSSQPPEVLEDTKLFNIDINAIPEEAKAVILLMFPPHSESAEDYQDQDFTKCDGIFGALKDVTDTHALLYQWNKSNSQGCLLQALNIDTRNILYGPRWNESMPRYAATLGYTPLEPVKSENPNLVATESNASSSSQTPSIESTQPTDIPSAQFDWDGSGLTNPLEITPKDIPTERQSDEVKSDEILSGISIETEIIKHNKLDFSPGGLALTIPSDINAVPTQVQTDNESVKSLQLLERTIEDAVNTDEGSDFNDFTSFQSSSKSKENNTEGFLGWSSLNAIPLRETHISNSNLQSKDKQSDDEGWLKPTIVTPDVPMKETTAEIVKNDFQTIQTVEHHNVENVTEEIKAPTVNADDDEFTDFQSTLPVQPTTTSFPTYQPLQPTPGILEPLQPSVIYPTASTNTSTVINWPDPGVTDDDLKHIELFYKPATTTTETSEANDKPASGASNLETTHSGCVGEETAKEESSVDDDDWSDFVSNQVPQNHPVQPSSFKGANGVKPPSRTSTPELQLSIPNLNQIQPSKKPVPVITQQSLQQATAPLPLIQPSIQPNKTYPLVAQQHSSQNGFQPSLISNQFAAQFGQGLLNQSSYSPKPMVHTVSEFKEAKSAPSQHHSTVQQTTSPIKSSIPATSKAEEFDDEWTDFVSSQPVASPVVISNGLHGNPLPKPNFDWNRPPQFTSWSTSVTPNIITNPVSFDTFQSYSGPVQSELLKNKVANRKNPNMVIQSKRSTIPSISAVPDMEFIAPKNRAWKK